MAACKHPSETVYGQQMIDGYAGRQGCFQIVDAYRATQVRCELKEVANEIAGVKNVLCALLAEGWLKDALVFVP
jgi:hypothetical protein